MALDSSQKNKILRYLCYPYGTLVTTSLDYSKIVSDKLSGISGEAQTEVELLLGYLKETDEALDAAISQSGVKKIDDIEFFGAGEGSKADILRKEKRRYINELCSLIGIPSRCGSTSMGRICV